MTHRKNTPGMNMRDMKQRSMSKHRLDGISHSRQRLIDESSSPADLDLEDDFETAIHVAQGDGTFTRQSHYDGGSEGEDCVTLPVNPPDGWWD